MHTKIIERYFFFTLLFLAIFFVIILFRPFLSVIIISASLAVVLYPVYNWLKKKKLPDWLSAILVVLFFVIVLFGPLLGIGVLVFNQSQDIYQTVVNSGNAGTFINSLGDGINKLLPQEIQINVGQKVADLVTFITNNIAKVFSTTLTTIFSFLLVVLSLFYFLKDGAHWRKVIIVLSPLSDKDDEKILSRLARAVNGVMKGYLLIGLIQGTLMGLGLALFGVPNSALWGVVTAIASMVPTVGTALVSIPAIIFLLATGKSAQAVGLLAWSIVIVGTMDNILNPYIVGSKINVPPLLILFSVLGGIVLLGPVGILVGPLAVSLLYTLVSIYRNEFQETVN